MLLTSAFVHLVFVALALRIVVQCGSARWRGSGIVCVTVIDLAIAHYGFLPTAPRDVVDQRQSILATGAFVA